ncbi:hypothetical protein V8B97DRAFT_1987251 [Scleroderma yunnanense]
MSGPYVYTPQTYQPTSYLSYSPYAPRSPFIPAGSFPSSPLHPPSPYLGPAMPFPSSFGESYDDGYWPPRPRRPSWHAGMQPSPFLQTPGIPYRTRTRSFGSMWPGDAVQLSPWAYPYQSGTSAFEIHPLLNGEMPPTNFLFDMSLPTFMPIRFIGPGPGQSIVICEELSQPATNPPITRMRITHDAIPQWPIDIKLQYDEIQMAAMPPPITLGDVLYMIHFSMRRQISHHDWAKLSDSQHDAIALAYTRRYRRVSSFAEVEASQGVKRIDYLEDRFIFKGLIRMNDEDGFFHWKMTT